MRLLILFALALSLQAEDIGAGINCNSVESCKVAIDAKARELDAKINSMQAQIAAKDQQIAKIQQKLTFYQQSSFRCQDAMLDTQIDAQAQQPPRPAPAKPEAK